LRSPDPAVVQRAPFHPLLAKELWEVASGRALWTMLLIVCPLVGYSFFQAAALYSEASSAARDSPLLASGLSPFDGVLVPTFGALYVAVTLLFPFVAIRTLGREKETGALRLLVQLPYRVPTLITAKMTAIFGAWLAVVIPACSALAIWLMLGGHLYLPETLDLLLGHLLYGLLVGAIALFAASISESSATAAGEVEYFYGGRSDKSRSTSHREVLPLIYALAGRQAPTPIAGEDYPGYPLLANASPALAWFLGGLPLLIVVAWWWSRRPPQIAAQLIKHGGQP